MPDTISFELPAPVYEFRHSDPVIAAEHVSYMERVKIFKDAEMQGRQQIDSWLNRLRREEQILGQSKSLYAAIAGQHRTIAVRSRLISAKYDLLSQHGDLIEAHTAFSWVIAQASQKPAAFVPRDNGSLQLYPGVVDTLLAADAIRLRAGYGQIVDSLAHSHSLLPAYARQKQPAHILNALSATTPGLAALDQPVSREIRPLHPAERIFLVLPFPDYDISGARSSLQLQFRKENYDSLRYGMRPLRFNPATMKVERVGAEANVAPFNRQTSQINDLVRVVDEYVQRQGGAGAQSDEVVHQLTRMRSDLVNRKLEYLLLHNRVKMAHSEFSREMQQSSASLTMRGGGGSDDTQFFKPGLGGAALTHNDKIFYDDHVRLVDSTVASFMQLPVSVRQEFGKQIGSYIETLARERSRAERLRDVLEQPSIPLSQDAQPESRAQSSQQHADMHPPHRARSYSAPPLLEAPHRPNGPPATPANNEKMLRGRSASPRPRIRP